MGSRSRFCSLCVIGMEIVMELLEIFQVLGIEQTKDERAIKNAYRQKLALTNPEDNPEGFKRLRSAYEEACAYARTQEEEQQAAQQRDTTPSGLWVEKAAEIYGNIKSRQDVEKWKALFSEDVFLSLEEEENCRFKLFRFLMDHFRLPGAVWELFNKMLHITEDAGKLRERFPADFVRYLLSKCERGEEIEFSQFEGEEDAPYDLFLQYYDRCWQAIQDGELAQAEEYIKNAEELHIFHPVLEICKANLAVKQEKTKEAISRLLGLRERYPKDPMICYNTAELLWRNERKEEAAAIYEELKKENESHYMSNVRLTQWYYEQGSFKEAKKCAETVLSMGADDRFMELLAKINKEIEKDLEKAYERGGKDSWEAGLELGWCFLQDGKISAGIRLAQALEGRIPRERETERKGLLTKLLVEEAEYEQAAELSKVWQAHLEEKIAGEESGEERERDKDRIRQAYLIRIQCYRNLGYVDKGKLPLAIAEAEKIETGTGRDIGLLLEKAQIYMEMEEYEKSLELVRRLVEDYQVYAAYATSLEVYRRQWNAAGVIQAGRQCISYFPGYVRSYEHMAKVYLDLKYTDELKSLLEEAQANGIKSVILDAYRYQIDRRDLIPSGDELDEKLSAFRKKYCAKVSEGDEELYRKSLPMLTTYLYWFPGTFMLVERGIFHRSAHHYEEAREDFEKALAENPAQPYALNGLSFVYKYQGNYEKALIYIKKAILYGQKEMSPIIFVDMGNLYLLLGDYDRAAEAFLKYQEQAGKNVYSRAALGKALAKTGRLAEAEALIRDAYPRRESIFDLYHALVSVYQEAGQREKADELLEAWEKELGKQIPGWKTPWRFKRENQKIYGEIKNYYSKKGWQELMYGNKKDAMKWFVRCAEEAQWLFSKRRIDDIEEVWCDVVFASIVCGDDRQGKKYAEKLKDWLVKEEQSGSRAYYNREKGHLQIVFLAAWYTESMETLKEILDREPELEICHFCTQCVCKEMEGVRILYLLRAGEKEEAMKRLLRNLKRMPQDEYMIAIRHMKG